MSENFYVNTVGAVPAGKLSEGCCQTNENSHQIAGAA